jgi:hypothetical protein
MRSVALNDLAGQIVRTPATVHEALECMLDEVLEERAASALMPPAVERDVADASTWIRGALSETNEKGVVWRSIALLLPDGEPYAPQLILVNMEFRDDEEWADAIVWRSDDRLELSYLDGIGALIATLEKSLREEADYIMPLAYAAFLFRAALQRLDASELSSARKAFVSYTGGDTIAVPLGSK